MVRMLLRLVTATLVIVHKRRLAKREHVFVPCSQHHAIWWIKVVLVTLTALQDTFL